MRRSCALEKLVFIFSIFVCTYAQVTSFQEQPRAFRPQVLVAPAPAPSWAPLPGSWTQQSGLDSRQKSVQWLGLHQANYTGPFNFSLVSDDASYLWLGVVAFSGYSPTNALVRLNGTGRQQQSATTWLFEGEEYMIRIQYGNDADYAHMTATMNDDDLAAACTSLVNYLELVAVGSNGDLDSYEYTQATDGNLLTGWVGADASPRIDFNFKGATVSLGRIHYVMRGTQEDWFSSVTFVINGETFTHYTSCADATQSFDFDRLETSEVTILLGELCLPDGAGLRGLTDVVAYAESQLALSPPIRMPPAPPSPPPMAPRSSLPPRPPPPVPPATPPPDLTPRDKPKYQTDEPVYYEPYIWLFGSHRTVAANGTINDKGLGQLVFETAAGMAYNSTSKSMLFDGVSDYISMNQPVTLGTEAKFSATSGLVQTGFSTSVTIKAANVSKGGVLWEFSSATAILSLSIRPPGVYILRYQRKGGGDVNEFLGPTAVNGARAELLVRCLPGMLLCTIIELS
jgi:hypothetical protein